MANELTQEQIDSINNYSNSIQTLEDYVTACRQMPSMYVSGVGSNGYLSMIREIFQNAIDQIVMKESPANWASFYYDQNKLLFRAIDNGLGLPFDDIERIITTPNTSKNYVKVEGSGEYSSGLHGQGCKAVNALSEYLIAESYRYDGTAVRLTTNEGYPVGKPKAIPNKKKFNGTMIEFVPSSQIFRDDLQLDWKRVYTLIKQIVSRTPIGTTVDFEAIDDKGISHKEKIVNKDGIVRDLIERSNHPLCKPIVVKNDNGNMMLEAAFIYDGGDKDGPNPTETTVSFCNMCPCVGVHLDSTIDGICKWFSQYMNNIFLANSQQKNNKKAPLKVVASDIKTGLILSINAAMLHPALIGQSKEILSNPEMEPFCRDTIMSSLQEWAKNNPNDLLKLCKYFKDIAELRIKQNNEKVKIVNKYQSNAITGYPDKYVKPIKQKKEFFIVEGDSAAGTVTKGRDINTMGMFPIRGKLPNAFRTSRKDFLSNAEVQGIIKIVTGQDASRYDKNFDPIKDVEWEKIVFMADADIDGAHISSLLLRFFILYMPQLIQAGKVYKAVPPLYSIPKKGGGEEYFTRNYDFVKYVQKLYLNNNKVQHMNKKDLTGKDATLFFMKNEDYVYWLERLANTYAVEPMLIEMALFNHLKGTKIAQIQKELKKMYRFMDVKSVNDVTVFKGTIAEANTLIMNEQMLRDCKPMIDIINKNGTDWYYLVNGKVSSLYEVMKGFEKTQPNHLQRYKGLGEMDEDQLAESTLLPDITIPLKVDDGKKTKMVTGNRTLIRYTLEDAKEEIEIIRKYESDYSQLFSMVGTVSRQDLID